MKDIKLSDLHAHPKNPRLAPRDDVIEQIASQITAAGAFDQAHALIVRKNASGYEIISGHHRHLAAQKAGLKTVPCWVREMSDEDAYMALALNNAQGELHPLEEGMHAIGSGLDQKAYAERVGKPRTNIQHRWYAAEVAAAVPNIGHEIREHWLALSALRTTPSWLWRSLVSRLVSEGWTVEQARGAAQRFKDAAEPPAWADRGAIAEALAGGGFRTADLVRLASRVDQAEAALRRGDLDAERLLSDLTARLQQKRPSRWSEVDALCNEVEQEQAELIRKSQKQKEEDADRIARLWRNVSLEEWKGLTDGQRQQLLTQAPPNEINPGNFNAQENNSIEWAQWSWNPVTGCLHNCPYCYARDIAESTRMTKAYPNGFVPTFRPAAVLVPRTMKVPTEAKKDERYRNVFTCSMADLFGRWVPAEWIEAVLREIRAAPQWNFLCLTKFPKRMAEFDIPENAWMGTTVDRQERVANAEAAFAKIKSGVRWLSVEPMLTPLKFKHLDRFNWVVIGGSSASRETPEWKPPYAWWSDLVKQARDAGCKVYMKTNLLGKRLLELPFDAPLPEEEALPAVFDYLRNNPNKE